MKSMTPIVLAAAFAIGCGAEPVVEPGATSKTYSDEIPGTHAPNDLDPITAQRWIDDVRLGKMIGEDGVVAEEAAATRFNASEPIHVSMRVSDAPAGSVIKVAVLNQAGTEVWSDQRAVIAGAEHLQFTIDEGSLSAGSYETRVIVGDERVANKRFDVTATNA
jgi:hypothetical protein